MKPDRPPTKLADVARAAGVSPATVSRALNHPNTVRAELRERVAHAIRTLSYTPNGAGRALSSRRTHTIGAVVPTLGISIFADGIEAMQNRLSERGYTLLIGNSQYDAGKELGEIRSLIARGIDGLVLVGDAQLDETHRLIGQHRVPHVTTYVCRARPGLAAIGIDNEAAAHQMTRHLLELGHREFGVIANLPASNDRSRARYDGILRALRESGLPMPPSHVVGPSHWLAQGREGLRRLLAERPQVTAVVCTTDTLAIGALVEARAAGIPVPREVSITGFDDIEFAAQFDPPLTTVGVPASAIGEAAADHLVDRLAGNVAEDIAPFAHRLVLRGSSGPPGRKPRRPASSL